MIRNRNRCLDNLIYRFGGRFGCMPVVSVTEEYSYNDKNDSDIDYLFDRCIITRSTNECKLQDKILFFSLGILAVDTIV
jgi:hypothetical protein